MHVAAAGANGAPPPQWPPCVQALGVLRPAAAPRPKSRSAQARAAGDALDSFDAAGMSSSIDVDAEAASGSDSLASDADMLADSDALSSDSEFFDSEGDESAYESDEAQATLSEEMKSCHTMQDVVDVVEDEVAAVTAADVAVALYKLAYLSKSSSLAGVHLFFLHALVAVASHDGGRHPAHRSLSWLALDSCQLFQSPFLWDFYRTENVARAFPCRAVGGMAVDAITTQ